MLEQRLTQLHRVKLSKALFNSDVVESLRFLRLSVGEEAPAGMKGTGRLRSTAVDDRLVWRRDEPRSNSGMLLQKAKNGKQFWIEFHAF